MRIHNVSNFLFTFTNTYPRDAIKQTDNIIIDSGAFSMWNSGIATDIDAYVEFSKSLPQDDRYWFVCLEVIPVTGSTAQQKAECAEQGFRNYTYMKKYVDRVIPVHHYGESLDILERYQRQTDYIGL